ncbi:Thiamine transporter 2 [Folsomia candida]|uniref:Thiamine transporter 2 n=1 Tax=Folsomia candida TaxID=158441 RepID=A0A226EH78_FOLCA|nr:Thiamine transporter 2 [Folsomia candida]
MNYKGISQEDIVHVAFPIWTYTYLATLAVIFLVTDFLRYKSVIIFEGIAYVVTWVLITWGEGLTSLILVEVCYGIVCSTEVAYYTYIYAKVNREHYQKVTSYTYSAIFAGRFLGGVVAQLLVSFDLMNYHELNYISLSCVSIAVIFSLLLPSVNTSIYFHREKTVTEYNTFEIGNSANQTRLSKIKQTGRYLFEDFKDAYSSSYVFKWSLWWAVGRFCSSLILSRTTYVYTIFFTALVV